MDYILQNPFLTKINRFFNRTTTTKPSVKTPNYFFIETIDQFDIIKIAKADGIIIGNTTLTTAQGLLTIIRSANQRMVYLKPVFVSSLALYESLKHQVDGWYQPSDMQQLVATTTSINNRMKDLESDATNRDTPSNILRKTVQYLYTRTINELRPYAANASNMTYAFPFVNSIFPVNRSLEVAQILEIGVVEEWLEKEVVEKVKIDTATIEINAFKLTFVGEQLAKFGYYVAPKTIDLPEGILGLAPFQKLVNKELANVQEKQHDSFLIELGLIQKNISFLTAKAQEELALDCLLYLQKNGLKNVSFGFTPTNKLWLLLPNSTPKVAIAKAEKAFSTLQQMLRGILDVQNSLLELKLFKLQEKLPVIQ